MSTVYVVIGPSNAGKTMFVSNSFIVNKPCKYYKDIIGVTETDVAYLIGNWLLDKRIRGTDVIARQHLGKIFTQIEVLNKINPAKSVVIEGFKIHSRPLINKLISGGYSVELYYLYCSLATSRARNFACDPNSTATYRLHNWIYTSAKNLYLEYKSKIPCHFMNTERLHSYEDFMRLNLNTFIEDDDSILCETKGNRLFTI